MALTTLADITTEILVRSQQSTTTGFITDEMLNDWIKEKHRWAASFKKWPFTEGRVSTTYASLATDEDGELRGEYPEGWKPESIRLMSIGGKRITKMDFQSYKRFREDQPSSQDKFFTDYGRLYFLNPNANVGGTIAMWGQYTPKDIDVTDSTATTIFSSVDEDGNEAIVEAVVAMVLQRGKQPQESQLHMGKAIQLLSGIWDKIQSEQYEYRANEAGMFEFFDVTRGGFRDDIVKRDRWY